MRTFAFISILLSLSLSSCSKKEGCRDPEALNFDASAEKEGTCRYTKVIFYAPSNRVGGTADRVVKIEISIGAIPYDTLVGTITTFDHPVPTGCQTPEGAFEYEIPGSGVPYTFLTRYYYEGGSNEPGDTYNLQAFNDKECHTVELTL